MSIWKGRFFLTAAAFIALVPVAFAQRYSDWRIFRTSDGLPESQCISVTVGLNGKVLTRHLNSDSISILNGYSLTSVISPEFGRNRVYEAAGGQLWTVTSGGLAEFRDATWRLHPIPEIARLVNGVTPLITPPVPIHIIKQGRVLILLPDELAELNVENPAEPKFTVFQLAARTGIGKFYGMTVARDGTLWISGEHGLEHTVVPIRNLKPGDHWEEFPSPPGFAAENFELPMQDTDANGLTCVAASPGSEHRTLVYFDGRNFTAQPLMDTQKIRGAWRGPGGTSWIVAGNAILQIDNSGITAGESEEIFNGRYFDVAVETNGTFWVASAEGLMRYSPPLWKSPRAIQRLNSPVPAITEDANAQLWFISAGTLHSLKDNAHQEYPFPRELHQQLQTTRLMWPLKNGDLLLDDGDQLFQCQTRSNTFNPLPTAPNEKQHTLGFFRDGSIAIETTDDNLPASRLGKYDGDTLRPVAVTPPDRVWTALIETVNGDIWLGGDHGALCYRDKQWLTSSNSNAPSPVVGFVETAGGKLWCATPDSIWELTGTEWFAVHAGFDHINSLIRARDGTIWVASNGGIDRFSQDAWLENSVDEGLPNGSARSVYEDRRGRIWVGTTRGLSLFHPEVDRDPPLTTIRKQQVEDAVSQSATVSMVFRGEDKWKYTLNDRLLYSYRLDQHDWSQFLDANLVSFSDLAGGPHSLEVRAMDRNGNIETKPARLTFSVVLPWYTETRLLLISLAGLGTALFFAGLAFNRHRKLLRSYAEVERKVAERTRALEVADRELVHSQKMNALGTLAAGIAHDFNNILSIIKGSAQIIEDNVENPDKVRTRVDRIKTVVEQGAGIVKAMLGFSAGSSDEPVWCDLNSVVNDTIQLLGDRFQRDAEVLFTPCAGLPQAPVVKEFVQQILLNFVFNAAESVAAAPRKQIIITLQATTALPPGLVLAPESAREYLVISVQDFGCGITPETLPRIFEPFFTTKALSARRGTGLGLSMVYELARKLQAGLRVESTVNAGSTFTLILPVRDPENINASNPNRSP